MNRIIQQMHANTSAQNTVAPSYSETKKLLYLLELQTFPVFIFTSWNLAWIKNFWLKQGSGTYLNHKTALDL